MVERRKKVLVPFVLAVVLVAILPGVASAAPPEITSLSPDRGPVGAPLTINGANLSTATEVRFGDVVAVFTVDIDGTIGTTVPEGAKTGPVTVTTVDGVAVSTDIFTVQPNIVLILSDDQPYSQLPYMPNVQSELVDKGVSFPNAFVVDPLCCPSRTTILTGKYSHGTDIYANSPPDGGFATFTDRGEDTSTIATWLQGAGYDNALVGKYLNGYSEPQVAYVPPGWDTWNALMVGPGTGVSYRYPMSINGTEVYYGTGNANYQVDVLSNYATQFIDSAPASKPLFLYFAPMAPHAPATPPTRYKTACADIPPNRPPNYNEADVTDKPPYIRQLKLWTPPTMASHDAFYTRQCQVSLSVDDAVGNIVSSLQATGRLSDTLFVYLTDNGLANGEHRWDKKTVPYEESIHVPFVVRYDPLTQGTASVDNNLVLNLDLASTFAEAGAVAAPGVEGVSFLPLLSDPSLPWRSDFLIEHEGQVSAIPSYCAVRSKDYLYVRYGTGYQELYDLSGQLGPPDPYEMDNLMFTRKGDPIVRAVRRTMYARMLQLCDPPPPGYVP